MRTELPRKVAELAQLKDEFDGDSLPLPVETTKGILLRVERLVKYSVDNRQPPSVRLPRSACMARMTRLAGLASMTRLAQRRPRGPSRGSRRADVAIYTYIYIYT